MMITDFNSKVWDTVGGWQSKQTSKGLLEAVVIEERTTSPVKSCKVAVRVTPIGQTEPRLSFQPVANIEAGNRLIADQFTKAS